MLSRGADLTTRRPIFSVLWRMFHREWDGWRLIKQSTLLFETKIPP